MRIAIISDIHDHRQLLSKALQRIEQEEIDEIFCCGDLCSPFIIKDLGEGFPGPIQIVFGNNDGDLFRITRLSQDFPNITLHGEICEMERGGRSIALTHFDTVAAMISRERTFDVVCFGHNHKFEITAGDHALRINPGEIMGELTGTSSFVILETETMEARQNNIKN